MLKGGILPVQPLIEKVAGDMSPPAAYNIFKNQPYSYLLDSGMVHKNLGRYSFAGADPFLVFSSQNCRCSVRRREGYTVYSTGNPFDYLGKLFNDYRQDHESDLPLSCGGAVGFFSYDMGRHLERIPSNAVNDLNIPESIMAFYDRGVIIDHIKKETFLFSSGLPYEREERERYAKKRLQELKEMFLANDYREDEELKVKGDDLSSNFAKDSYLRAVEEALDYIGRGDIYQVNMTQRLEARLRTHPWDLYRTLRKINPAPFAAYLAFPEVTVVSSSPERFMRQNGNYIETRPIKGTRRRGKTEKEDNELRQELLDSKKDRAELVMIVDLERNDLNRVCKTGTVSVPELFTLEEYATVYHLVSTVTGEITPDKSILDVVKASFPGGSITGAPKIRAMEIIEELEPVRRGIYTGSIGYIDFSRRADLNIVIRTMIIKKERVYLQVGGGIVADSSPGAEYQETLDKARALLNALGFQE